jgi:hypothetical protein
VDATELRVTFGPAPADWAALSKSSRTTLETIFRHPIAHNLDWSDAIALFGKIGTVEHKSDGQITFGLGDQRHAFRTAHAKDLAVADVMAVRHLLSREGWSPPTAFVAPASLQGASPEGSERPDLLVVIEHHRARLYRLEVRSADQAAHVIEPYDPHHFLHHLSHKDQSRESGQRAPEDPAFYETVARALVLGGRIVVIGHGRGHSDAARHLIEHLRTHHAEIFQRVAPEVAADLSALTSRQLLDVGRRALSA